MISPVSSSYSKNQRNQNLSFGLTIDNSVEKLGKSTNDAVTTATPILKEAEQRLNVKFYLVDGYKNKLGIAVSSFGDPTCTCLDTQRGAATADTDVNNAKDVLDLARQAFKSMIVKMDTHEFIRWAGGRNSTKM
jgi:hypothetical protein